MSAVGFKCVDVFDIRKCMHPSSLRQKEGTIHAVCLDALISCTDLLYITTGKKFTLAAEIDAQKGVPDFTATHLLKN
jgi:hypothetical protein